jgi:hypothetical protein
MSQDTVHFPLDFELREEVRRLDFRLQVGDGDPVLILFRLWTDYGRSRTDWRPISRAWAESYDWSKCDLSGLLESYLGWPRRGELVPLLINAKVLVLEQRGDVWGLALPSFAQLNPQLLPGYRSIQQKGREALTLKLRNERLEKAADQQVALFETQGSLVFEERTVTTEVRKKAVALIMKLDAACGKHMRTVKQYEEDRATVTLAVEIVRQKMSAEIDQVIRFIHAQREDPTVPKDTGLILRDFDQVLQLSCNRG